MGYGEYLKELLRPLGVYDLENGTFACAELDSEGAALDRFGAELDRVAREMNLCTAGEEGLVAVESLLARRPVAADPDLRREALAALLRIGGDSFTPAAINDTLVGCGIRAVATETDRPNQVVVSFPDTPGIPDDFEELTGIIEEILPAHVGIEYVFRFLTWRKLEETFPTWEGLGSGRYTWSELDKLA